MPEDSLAGMVVEQEALELHQDLEVPRFIRRTFQKKVAGNILAVHRALCELAAAGGSKAGEWDQTLIEETACMSQRPVSISLMLLEQYGLVQIFVRRNDQGHKLKPVIRLVNIPRLVQNPNSEKANRATGPNSRKANRALGQTTTGSGVLEKDAQVEIAHNMVGLEPKILQSKESAGRTSSPAHASASPGHPETTPPAQDQPAGKSRKYFMLPSAREDWGAPWEAAHPGAVAFWAGKEVSLWQQFENSGPDRGTRKLMVACYLADRDKWPVENKHPLGGLVKNGPRYQKAAEEFLATLDRRARAAPVMPAELPMEPILTREDWLANERLRRALGLPPDEEPPGLVA